jgi:hypothetical protein
MADDRWQMAELRRLMIKNKKAPNCLRKDYDLQICICKRGSAIDHRLSPQQHRNLLLQPQQYGQNIYIVDLACIDGVHFLLQFFAFFYR